MTKQVVQLTPATGNVSQASQSSSQVQKSSSQLRSPESLPQQKAGQASARARGILSQPNSQVEYYPDGSIKRVYVEQEYIYRQKNGRRESKTFVKEEINYRRDGTVSHRTVRSLNRKSIKKGFIQRPFAKREQRYDQAGELSREDVYASRGGSIDKIRTITGDQITDRDAASSQAQRYDAAGNPLSPTARRGGLTEEQLKARGVEPQKKTGGEQLVRQGGAVYSVTNGGFELRGKSSGEQRHAERQRREKEAQRRVKEIQDKILSGQQLKVGDVIKPGEAVPLTPENRAALLGIATATKSDIRKSTPARSQVSEDGRNKDSSNIYSGSISGNDFQNKRSSSSDLPSYMEKLEDVQEHDKNNQRLSLVNKFIDKTAIGDTLNTVGNLDKLHEDTTTRKLLAASQYKKNKSTVGGISATSWRVAESMTGILSMPLTLGKSSPTVIAKAGKLLKAAPQNEKVNKSKTAIEKSITTVGVIGEDLNLAGKAQKTGLYNFATSYEYRTQFGKSLYQNPEDFAADVILSLATAGTASAALGEIKAAQSAARLNARAAAFENQLVVRDTVTDLTKTTKALSVEVKGRPIENIQSQAVAKGSEAGSTEIRLTKVKLGEPEIIDPNKLPKNVLVEGQVNAKVFLGERGKIKTSAKNALVDPKELTHQSGMILEGQAQVSHKVTAEAFDQLLQPNIFIEADEIKRIYAVTRTERIGDEILIGTRKIGNPTPMKIQRMDAGVFRVSGITDDTIKEAAKKAAQEGKAGPDQFLTIPDKRSGVEKVRDVYADVDITGWQDRALRIQNTDRKAIGAQYKVTIGGKNVEHTKLYIFDSARIKNGGLAMQQTRYAKPDITVPGGAVLATEIEDFRTGDIVSFTQPIRMPQEQEPILGTPIQTKKKEKKPKKQDEGIALQTEQYHEVINPDGTVQILKTRQAPKEELRQELKQETKKKRKQKQAHRILTEYDDMSDAKIRTRTDVLTKTILKQQQLQKEKLTQSQKQRLNLKTAYASVQAQMQQAQQSHAQMQQQQLRTSMQHMQAFNAAQAARAAQALSPAQMQALNPLQIQMADILQQQQLQFSTAVIPHIPTASAKPQVKRRKKKEQGGSRLQQGYLGFVRRFGKDVPISATPMTKADIMKIGLDRLANTAAATLKLRKANVMVKGRTKIPQQLSRNYRTRVGKTGDQLIIERRGLRMNTRGELEQIQGQSKKRGRKNGLF